MSRRKRAKDWKGPAMGPDGVREPPAYKVRSLSEQLRDLQGELLEQAEGARMGASLLVACGTFPEASRFLEGMHRGIENAALRLKGALDSDEIPF
jgi:hypothetical protein